jgi:hypothetical protein
MKIQLAKKYLIVGTEITVLFSSDFNHSYTQQINKGYIYSRHIKEDKSLTSILPVVNPLHSQAFLMHTKISFAPMATLTGLVLSLCLP